MLPDLEVVPAVAPVLVVQAMVALEVMAAAVAVQPSVGPAVAAAEELAQQEDLIATVIKAAMAPAQQAMELFTFLRV